jgi:hypothetical protein
MSKGDTKIVDEHFWFTAMTVGFNAFVIDKMEMTCHGREVLYATTLVNLYAIFLILHRAAAHAGKLKYPRFVAEMDETSKWFYHKGIETLCHFAAAIRMIPTVLFEFSGALFYILLITLSYLGVIMK